MSAATIRAYQGDDEPDLLELWNAALPYDPIDRPTFRRKVLLDPNFSPDHLLLAESDGALTGFSLCLMRRVPMDKVGLEPERGWITAFGVAPDSRRQGIGDALLGRAMEAFAAAGRREVLIAPYTPNYFVPGVDVERYAEGLAFLQKRGFGVVSRPLSMDANIVLFDYAPWAEREAKLQKQGISVRSMRPVDIPRLLELLEAHMPGDWLRHARELLLDISKGLGDHEQFTLALRAGEVVGYCQFEREHFGPFGVRSDLQGRGIGTVLLAQCLRTMQRKGLHNAWVLWTSDELARRVYGKFGFRETRRFAVLRCEV
jgi:mycothiol synthase